MSNYVNVKSGKQVLIHSLASVKVKFRQVIAPTHIKYGCITYPCYDLSWSKPVKEPPVEMLQSGLVWINLSFWAVRNPLYTYVMCSENWFTADITRPSIPLPWPLTRDCRVKDGQPSLVIYSMDAQVWLSWEILHNLLLQRTRKISTTLLNFSWRIFIKLWQKPHKLENIFK